LMIHATGSRRLNIHAASDTMMIMYNLDVNAINNNNQQANSPLSSAAPSSIL